MKNKLYIIALLSIITLSAYAQTFQSAAKPEYIAFQSMQILKSGMNYNSRVYEPFSTTTPSELYAAGASYSPSHRGPKRTQSASDPWGENQDGGITNDNSSPIGDAVWPLLAFALMFCGVIALRRKRSALKS